MLCTILGNDTRCDAGSFFPWKFDQILKSARRSIKQCCEPGFEKGNKHHPVMVWLKDQSIFHLKKISPILLSLIETVWKHSLSIFTALQICSSLQGAGPTGLSIFRLSVLIQSGPSLRSACPYKTYCSRTHQLLDPDRFCPQQCTVVSLSILPERQADWGDWEERHRSKKKGEILGLEREKE